VVTTHTYCFGHGNDAGPICEVNGRTDTEGPPTGVVFDKEKGLPGPLPGRKTLSAAKRNDPFLSQLLLPSQLPEGHDHDSTDQGQKTTEQHERHHLATFL